MTDLLMAVLIGACLGSFIATLAKRHETATLSILSERSRCADCHAVLGVGDLVPILSWLWLRGRCRYCNARLGAFEPMIEAVAMVLPLAAFLMIGDPQIAWMACLFGWWLLALAAIDLRTYLLPNWLTLPLLAVGLAMSAMANPELPPIDLAMTGAAAGYALFRVIAFVYERLRGRVGLGGGDAKLMAAIGAWVGITHLPMVLLVGSGLGLSYAALSLARTSAMQAIPFGPALAIAAWPVFIGQAFHAG